MATKNHPDSAALTSECQPVDVLRCISGDQRTPVRDVVAREEPLEIRIRGRGIAVIMRTPGCDAELAAGFLLSEGLIRQREDVIEIAHCQEGEAANYQNVLNVFLRPDLEVDFETLSRYVFASSSCGLCGKSSIESVHQHFPPLASASKISAKVLLSLPDKLRTLQRAFAETGGIHAAGIFDRQGDVIVLREDVGRHNAVDKAIGFGFLNRHLPFDAHVLLVSGRASFEIMQKALAARIPIVAAISAPSSLAVEFARESGQTLVGFIRGESMNLYSEPDRIRNASEADGQK